MVTLQIAGLEVTLLALKNSKMGVRKAIGPAIIAGGRTYKTQVRRRINLKDHTQRDLNRRDNPYAKRHGSIRIHRKKPWQVHNQTGRMVNALQGRPITVAGQTGFEVTFDYGAVPYARHIIQGTKVMLPRDFLIKTAMDPVTQTAMMKRIVKTLGKKLRTQLGVRFGSTTPGGSFGGGGGASAVR